ncbi:MAG TPA: hypothetical protein VF855_01720 [Acidimicrobiales bacterium]
MHDSDLELARIAEQQDGVFHLDDSRRAEMSADSLWRRRRRGIVVRVGTKTFRFAGTPLTWHGQLRAALLDLGPDAVVGGRSAGALHELDGIEPGPVELLVPRRQRHRSAAAWVRSVGVLRPGDRAEVSGFPCLSATRTLLDLAGLVGAEELGVAASSAFRRGLCSVDYLGRRYEAMWRPGLPGAAAIEGLLADGPVESWLERRFMALVRSAGLPEPALQRVYRAGTRVVARVDAEFTDHDLIAEVGGKKGYLSPAERQRKEHRRNALTLRGKTLVFFCSEDIVDTPSYVIGTLRAACPLSA